MYLIPKNIKVKREIFKGIGIIELLSLFITGVLGFYFSSLTNSFHLKIFLFAFLPLINIILIIPLPNGGTIFLVLKKYFIFKTRQKNFKYK